MHITELVSIEQWEDLKNSSQDKYVFVFKHSTTCPISADAWSQFLKYIEHSEQPAEYAMVKVIESRPVSNHIAEATGVKHESPQALLLVNGNVVWNASHFSITQKSLTAARAAH